MPTIVVAVCHPGFRQLATGQNLNANSGWHPTGTRERTDVVRHSAFPRERS